MVQVPRVDCDKLTDERLGEPSAAIRGRIEKAREAERQRLPPHPFALLGQPRMESRDKPQAGAHHRRPFAKLTCAYVPSAGRASLEGMPEITTHSLAGPIQYLDRRRI